VTRDEWLQVRVGDAVIDRKLKGSPRRKVLEVHRVMPRRGGSKNQRTTLDTLGNGHGERFLLVRRPDGAASEKRVK
jgi:hypothetical protein